MRLNLKRALQKLISRRKSAPKRRLELTVVDQLALRSLFLMDSGEEDSIVSMVLDERPSTIPHEVPASLRKLALFRLVEQIEGGRYRVSRKGRELRRVIPERPGVNIDYYG